MTKLTKYDPFSELRAMQRHFFGDDWLTPLTNVNMPTTDVYTTDDEKQLIVEAHLPNFEQDDIDIHVENGALVIQAEKHEKEEDKKKKYVVRESSSSFYRRISLPEHTSSDTIEAHMEDGILKVIVPMTPPPEPRKIAVKTRASKKGG
jgi:HSP20 family protein